MAAKKGVAQNPSGVDKTSRMSRASLAAKAREFLHDGDIIIQYYAVIAGGHWPEEIKEDGKIVGYKEKTYKEFERKPEVTLDQMMLAFARLVERGYGQAPQHQVIEQTITAEITAIAGGVDTSYVQRLGPDALRAIKAAVKGLPAAKPQDPKTTLPEQEPILDAEFEDA